MSITGIYVLEFLGTQKVYIGQSVNIEKRYTTHIKKLKDGTHNYKMMEAFKRFGFPALKILLECSREDLNKYEVEAFEIYNSINNGFNIASEPDIHQEGEKNGGSKYSNSMIVEVLDLLLDMRNSFKTISKITGVHESTIRHINNGEAHTWLERKYPEKYASIKRITGQARKAYQASAAGIGKVYPPVISPEGQIHRVENANVFAREHGMDSSYFIKMLNGKALTCKGWKLA